jgi:hypothetical protein
MDPEFPWGASRVAEHTTSTTQKRAPVCIVLEASACYRWRSCMLAFVDHPCNMMGAVQIACGGGVLTELKNDICHC